MARDCASEGGNNTECGMRMVEGQMVKICVSTCATDGCNSAKTVFASYSASLVLTLTLLVILLIHIEDT